MRNILDDKDKKQKLSISVSPVLTEAMSDIKNKSKYIEWLIYQDMIKKNKIKENTQL